jgi:hypothetical protein
LTERMPTTPGPRRGAPPAADRTAERQRAERRRLRRFGLTVGIAFLALAALLWWKHRPAWPVCAALGGALALLGLAVPVVLGPVERVWMKLAGYLGWFMTRVILGLVFLLVFTPAGLIMRLLGRDPLKQRFDHGAASYWEMRAEHDRGAGRMERMF